MKETQLCAATWMTAICLSTCFATAGLASASETPIKPNNSTQLSRLVDDVCQKHVVLLGEDANHGSGATLEVKVSLVKQLVEKCGFSSVMFESQVYDFVDLEHSFSLKTATPEKVADAIGGLWSTTSESDPLISYLFQAARTGRVKLLGLDPQLGGATQLYSQRRLSTQLTSYLNEARRGRCEAEIFRLANWQFDDTHQYDDTVRVRLRRCVAAIEDSISRQPVSTPTLSAELMAKNLSRFLDMSAQDSFAVRDRAMYDNFVWYRARMRSGAKSIIWCATVHAAKQGVPNSNGSTPLGAYIHQALGNDAAAIGFTALSGSYGRRKELPTVLTVATADSLEGHAFAGSSEEVRYLDSKQLNALGVIAARPINYANSQLANWGTILDGLLVLRQERPPQFVRSATPQQTIQGVRARARSKAQDNSFKPKSLRGSA